MTGFAPLEALPDEWKTTAVLHVSGGRDRYGNHTEGTDVQIPGFLIAGKQTGEGTDYATVSTDKATGFAPRNITPAPKQSDEITTPAGSTLPGRWQIDGQPVAWPGGYAMNLRRIA